MSSCGLLWFDQGQHQRSDAGNWLFCGRRWIDPSDPDGRIKLDLHYHNLCALFPAFATDCSHDRFIGAVSAVIDSWSRHAEAESDPPSVDPTREEVVDDGRLRLLAQTAQAGDGERSTVVSAAELDLDDWAWPSLQADLVALWPPAGLSSFAPGSACSAREGEYTVWAG